MANSSTTDVNAAFRLEVMVNLLTTGEAPTAELVESRIRALRQIYAMNFLFDAGREGDLVKAFAGVQPADLKDLLNEDDKLLIKSASTGSLWLTLAAKSSAAWNSLKGIAPLFFDEGRQAVVERVRANTELTKIEVDKKRFELGMQKADCMIALYNKIEKTKIQRSRRR